MRFLLLFFLFVFNYSLVDAQRIYAPKKVVKGENATYYCDNIQVRNMLSIRNVNNRDTTYVVYFNDGKVASEEELECISFELQYEFEDVVRAFREMLTEEEWNKIKGKTGGFFIGIVFDKDGMPDEVSFTIFNNDSLMRTLDPDRLYQLEQKVKTLVRLRQKKSGRYIVNFKSSIDIYYWGLK